MKLIKQEGGVWVNLTDGKPTKPDAYWVLLDDNLSSKNAAWFDGKEFTTYTNQFIIAWLKPFEKSYILTEEELCKVIDAYELQDSHLSNGFVQSITI